MSEKRFGAQRAAPTVPHLLEQSFTHGAATELASRN